jgi:gamma-tubulin complex component 5
VSSSPWSDTEQSNPTKFNLYRETALRTLRYSNYPRTDQFDIANQLDGLEEKFRVYNEDPLADALRERLDELAKREGKWTPEVLHLLLELSDQPVSKSRVENLEFLKEPEEEKGPPLKWRDLVAEDPLLREKSVWKNVDFGAESSEEEDGGFEDSGSEISRLTDTTNKSSVDDEIDRHPEDLLVDTLDREELERVLQAQFWRKTPSINGVKLETVKTHITELQAIREALFMLSGFPSSLFEMDSAKPAVVKPAKRYALKHASMDAYQQLANDFADQGSALMILRSWAKRPQSVPLLQVLQNSIAERVWAFDASMSKIQQQFVAPTEDIVVSLISVKTEVTSCVRPLVRLSHIIKRLDSEPYSHAFRYLEMLYDETCTSQMAGDDEMYAFMGKIFFECFEVYLRPIRTWMEEGELGKLDKVFFVSEVVGEVEPASVWQSRYKIRKNQNGVLHAPRFLHAAANRISTTGKSVVVLKYLNQFETSQSFRTTLEPRLDFDTVCRPSELQLASFPELFDVAFDAWVQSKHHYASLTLRKTLFDSCGLHTSLDALSYLYFMADGTTAASFTNSIFDKLDTLDESWNDRFTLTELAQSTFGSLSPINPDRLRTSILSLPQKYHDVAKCRRSVQTLGVIEMKYHLTWPIQIILTPATIPSYQRIFTFFLQIRRTSHFLSRQRLVTFRPSQSNHADEGVLYYALRSRLLWFTSTLYYYLTSLVVEPNTQAMLSQLKEAADVDSMIGVHSSYIKSTVEQALLGSKLELIHKTILKILDLGIKLEDAQAVNAVRERDEEEQRRDMLDVSLASLGLHAPQKPKQKAPFAFKPQSKKKNMKVEESSEDEDEDEKEIDVDLSILSSNLDEGEEPYTGTLRKIKRDLDAHLRFVTNGLRGVARAGGAEQARCWDVLAEMLESGFGTARW